MKIQKMVTSGIFIFSLSLVLSSCGLRPGANPVTLVASCSLDDIAGATKDADTHFSTSLSTPDMILRGWIANDLSGTVPEKLHL